MREKRIAVLGLARSGRSLALALRQRGVAVSGGDRRPETEVECAAELRARGVALFFSGPDAAFLDGADLLAISPGVSTSAPIVREARSRGIPVLPEVELAWRILEEEAGGRNRYAGVTGTNGKSTVATWSAELLKGARRPVALAGNIGTPLADFCASREARDFVLELSSFQLETIDRLRLDVAVVTNITPDHLDRHGTFQKYAAAKARILENQRGSDAAVLNEDDPEASSLSAPGRRVGFSRRRAIPGGIYVESGEVVSEISGKRERLLSAREISLSGVHNLENAMAAAAVAECLGVDAAMIAKGLRNFPGLPHRSRKVAVLGGVEWVNDSKGTNPDATVKSLAGYPDRSVVLILGGSEKGSDFSILRGEVGRAARVVLTIGQSAERIERVLDRLDPLDVRRAETLERAVEEAARLARPGETVLLSPACASFDQFRDFEHRGARFEELVRERSDGS
ncbi:MAG: UDP-N-acetylmuramoyl-L-alanine--D-glutamate ligase [Thermoanaerobaculia bacterium]